MSMTRKDFRLFAVEFGQITNPDSRAAATDAFCRVARGINPRFDAWIFRNAVHDEVQRRMNRDKCRIVWGAPITKMTSAEAEKQGLIVKDPPMPELTPDEIKGLAPYFIGDDTDEENQE